MDAFNIKRRCFVIFFIYIILSTFCANGYAQLLPVLGEVKTQVYFRDYEGFSPAMLQCYIEGFQNETYKYWWTKNEQPFNHTQDPVNIIVRKNGGDLVFLRPTEQDVGVYRCYIETDIGIASSPQMNLSQAYIIIPKVTPEYHNPVRGRPYKLECPMPKSYPKPSVVWVSKHSTDPSISSSILDRRITQGGDGNLYFSTVTENDVSHVFEYVCLGFLSGWNELPVMARHFIANLTEDSTPPSGGLVPQYLSKNVTAHLGEDAFIYCIFGGSPLTPPEWHKDGVNVNGGPTSRITRYNRSAGKRLLIRNVTLEDEGTYVCTVNNGVSPPVDNTAYLTVVGKPRFIHAVHNQSILQPGTNLQLECIVEGKPTPALSWTYNTYPIKEDARVKIETTNSKYTVKSLLVISNVIKSDRGYYGCSATNIHGSAYTETAVDVRGDNLV